MLHLLMSRERFSKWNLYILYILYVTAKSHIYKSKNTDLMTVQ